MNNAKSRVLKLQYELARIQPELLRATGARRKVLERRADTARKALARWSVAAAGPRPSLPKMAEVDRARRVEADAMGWARRGRRLAALERRVVGYAAHPATTPSERHRAADVLDLVRTVRAQKIDAPR